MPSLLDASASISLPLALLLGPLASLASIASLLLSLAESHHPSMISVYPAPTSSPSCLPLQIALPLLPTLVAQYGRNPLFASPRKIAAPRFDLSTLLHLLQLLSYRLVALPLSPSWPIIACETLQHGL